MKRMSRFIVLMMMTAMLSTAVWSADAPAAKAKNRGKAKATAKTPAKAKAKAPVQAQAKKAAPAPAPTIADLPYGSDPRQVLDFWKAKSDKPTPVLFFIHGGGWMNGDKNNVIGNGLQSYLDAGISVVSIRYRFVSAAQAAGVKPPVQWPLEDAARALQFVRSKAGEWGLDKTRIGASGGSAGACSSLWLAFHDDMAKAGGDDPIARESTRLACAGVIGPQTTLDPKQMREWIPNSKYGGHAFGFFTDDGKTGSFDKFYAGRDQIMPWIKEYSPYEWAGAGDPPICMTFSAAPAPAGQPEKDPTHSAHFGLGLKKKLDAAGVESYVVYPGLTDVKYKTVQEFLIDKLKK